MNISGATVLISGGSSGIGAALVKTLSEQGATVFSVDKNMPNDPVAGVEYLPADLTNAGELAAALEKVTGPIDLLINNAGTMRRGTIFDSSEEDYDFLMNNNVKSAWLFLKSAKPKLASDATVVQISSGHAIKSEPNPGLYTISKKSTAALAEVLALTCPDYTVKIVYPGPVLTPLLLSGRDKADQERIAKLATDPLEFAGKVAQFIESDARELRFEYNTWGYTTA